jgi:catechol 2,3-dioxygenase-like lactoylglutathione lyase family enzyme
VRIDLVALIVEDYDPAIAFFTGVLGFDLVEDSPAVATVFLDIAGNRWDLLGAAV